MTQHSILSGIVSEVNSRASHYQIGSLQQIRKQLKSLRRLPSTNIFGRIFRDEEPYTFHVGGRTELQFNLGLERIREGLLLRHGVAFSLETSQTLPKIDPLFFKIERFNEFLRLFPDELADFSMWHYQRNLRSENRPPAPITPDLAAPHVFVFLGRLSSLREVQYDQILSDFDRLLPLYRFVEGSASFPSPVNPPGKFAFKSGCAVKPTLANANISARILDVQLRHNALQMSLYRKLVQEFGEAQVGTELPNNGMRVDIVVKSGQGYWFYEIKTSSSARACIREALAQLLEYAYWPGGQEADRLIVAGEPELDQPAKSYIDLLRNRFALPIDYERIELEEELIPISASK